MVRAQHRDVGGELLGIQRALSDLLALLSGLIRLQEEEDARPEQGLLQHLVVSGLLLEALLLIVNECVVDDPVEGPALLDLVDLAPRYFTHSSPLRP